MIRAACFSLSLFLLVQAAAAEPHSSSKSSSSDVHRLVSLKASGTTRYTDKEILAASGLEIGQDAADGDFKEAARKLGDSGLFSDVVYSYTTSDTNVKVELQLTDTDKSKLIPAAFDNFVWFTDDQLRIALQTRVPLFKQVLPLTGNLPDRLSEALQAMLNEKQLPGRVDFLRQEDPASGALSAIIYRIEDVSIRIKGVDFPGASSEYAALLTTAGRRLTGAEYARSSVAAVAKFDLLPVYLQRGYLKAGFQPSDARVLPQPPQEAGAQDPPEVEVEAIVAVIPGKVYSSSGVEWKGNSALKAAVVAPLLHLQPGQPADAVRLGRDIENVIKLYHSRGYITVQIKPDPQFDDDKNAVHYDINVVEGDLYRMGELEIVGLDTQAKARMVAAWKLQEGQPYDADYPRKFLEDTGQLLPRDVHWDISIHESPEPRDKTVDLEIRFKQQ
jgi:outer membrane protein assembly factor BamA